MIELSKKRKVLETRKLQIEHNLTERPTYISDEILALEDNPKELNLNFNQLGKKIIITDRTLSFDFRDASNKKITYRKYSQREKAYEIERNFIIMEKDGTHESLEKFSSGRFIGSGDEYYAAMEEKHEEYEQGKTENTKIKIVEFLNSTEIVKQIK